MTDNFMIGNRYTRLTVIGKTDERRHGRPVYLCTCICGNEKRVCGRDLKQGRVRSCGCLYRDIKRAKGLAKLRYWSPLDEIDEDIIG